MRRDTKVDLECLRLGKQLIILFLIFYCWALHPSPLHVKHTTLPLSIPGSHCDLSPFEVWAHYAPPTGLKFVM